MEKQLSEIKREKGIEAGRCKICGKPFTEDNPKCPHCGCCSECCKCGEVI